MRSFAMTRAARNEADSEPRTPHRDVNRLVAFSDAVFAITVTLPLSRSSRRPTTRTCLIALPRSGRPIAATPSHSCSSDRSGRTTTSFATTSACVHSSETRDHGGGQLSARLPGPDAPATQSFPRRTARRSLVELGLAGTRGHSRPSAAPTDTESVPVLYPRGSQVQSGQATTYSVLQGFCQEAL
jgi:hypothetical protein